MDGSGQPQTKTHHWAHLAAETLRS